MFQGQTRKRYVFRVKNYPPPVKLMFAAAAGSNSVPYVSSVPHGIIPLKKTIRREILALAEVCAL